MCLCVYLYTHVHVGHVCINVFTGTRRGQSLTSMSPSIFLHLLFETQSLLNPKLTNPTALAGSSCPPPQCWDCKSSLLGAGHVGQWLRALAARPEDRGSIPSMRITAHNCL